MWCNFTIDCAYKCVLKNAVISRYQGGVANMYIYIYIHMYMYKIWDAFPKNNSYIPVWIVFLEMRPRSYTYTCVYIYIYIYIYPCRIPRCICFLFSRGVARFFPGLHADEVAEISGRCGLSSLVFCSEFGDFLGDFTRGFHGISWDDMGFMADWWVIGCDWDRLKKNRQVEQLDMCTAKTYHLEPLNGCAEKIWGLWALLVRTIELTRTDRYFSHLFAGSHGRSSLQCGHAKRKQ